MFFFPFSTIFPGWFSTLPFCSAVPQVAEATEARLRRQADQEETARKRAEEAQQRAKKRLVQRAMLGREADFYGRFWRFPFTWYTGIYTLWIQVPS